MLQGFSQHKLTSLVRGANHKPMEDLMTSAIFGGLAFMPGAWAVAVLGELLREAGDALPQHIDDVSVTLWPRVGRIEPDVVLDFSGATSAASHRVIVEVKWDAPFHENQALQQWIEDGRRQDTTHLLLVRLRSQGMKHIDECRKSTLATAELRDWWANGCRVATWSDLMTVLRRLATSENRKLAGWASSAEATAAIFGERAFSGFQMLAETHIASEQDSAFFKSSSQFFRPGLVVETQPQWSFARREP